jgi:PAS domain S-box-containing protein
MNAGLATLVAHAGGTIPIGLSFDAPNSESIGVTMAYANPLMSAWPNSGIAMGVIVGLCACALLGAVVTRVRKNGTRTSKSLETSAVSNGKGQMPDDLLQTLLDNSPDYIYFKDLQSRFVCTSKELGRHNGITDGSQLSGRTDSDLFAEEHARAAYEDEQNIIRTGQPLIGKLEKETHRDGRMTWVLTTKMPWRDRNGKIIGTFGISKDVTAIKEAEQKIAYEQGFFQALIDHLPDALYFKDRESRFVRVSASKAQRSLEMVRAHFQTTHPDVKPEDFPLHLQSARAFGEHLIGKSDFAIFPEARARSAFDDEQKIIRTEQPILSKIERTPQLDGSLTWCTSTKIPWRDAHGKIIGTFGVSRDITELKKAEAELKATHKRLLETSRLAGMAEVASDVLHNVGNVLNSVNVSCTLAYDRVQETSYDNLAKTAQLVFENAHRADFLSADPRGRHIPEFLNAFVQSAQEQKSFLLHELSQLRGYIDHIKQIVTMQQNYAKVAGVEESVDLAQLLEDALHINGSALDRHAVKVEREIQPVSVVSVDKHKVLQILVNLIRNAKYALSESQRRDRVLTVRLHHHGEKCVQVQVADNGIGIAPENLTRIFAHGFTTRRDGHGFGLHSGAIAARDLGGSLTAHSDGLGLGATFTLELPFRKATEPAR